MIVRKIKEKRYHSRHVKPTFSNTKCPWQMDGPNCLELSTNILEATNCLKPMKSSLAHACYTEIYTSLFPRAFIVFKLEM